jgi:Family of unknown function (DUF6510)
MDVEERRLDGNVAAGLFGEIFPIEMTMVRTVCGTCGRMEPTGAQPVYTDAPGMVMRCLHCESVLIKLVHGGGRYWLDMRGVACMQVDE